ncbi:homogentisate 1,2-dioxygenase [Sphingomonas bacterium]|uniref:homogentisate 1,2-dioxygenase n=1 Tax=Sphingomonas bacterium TaxID=1895847 RepID=UPI0020C5EE48|nr:homogentisate 1,2-dioxygenase [Sphingomonas bacterium]
MLASLAVPALAQDMAMATPVCPRDAEPIPAGLAAWGNKTPLAAAKDEASVGQASLIPGTAVDLALADTPAVHYVVRPSHPGGSVSHGGMAGLVIATAGTYRVAIGSGAWVDLIKDKASLESNGHGHGPNCSGIRKMVDFALQPGSYIVQIAGNGEARIPVLVAKLP